MQKQAPEGVLVAEASAWQKSSWWMRKTDPVIAANAVEAFNDDRRFAVEVPELRVSNVNADQGSGPHRHVLHQCLMVQPTDSRFGDLRRSAGAARLAFLTPADQCELVLLPRERPVFVRQRPRSQIVAERP